MPQRVEKVICVGAASPPAIGDRARDRLELEPPGVAFVLAVRYKCERLHFFVADIDGHDARRINKPRHFPAPQIFEHALDARIRNEECDAATATASVESEHEAGSYGRSAITLR